MLHELYMQNKIGEVLALIPSDFARNPELCTTVPGGWQLMTSEIRHKCLKHHTISTLHMVIELSKPKQNDFINTTHFKVSFMKKHRKHVEGVEHPLNCFNFLTVKSPPTYRRSKARPTSNLNCSKTCFFWVDLILDWRFIQMRLCTNYNITAICLWKCTDLTRTRGWTCTHPLMQPSQRLQY